jgi:hypothetical protein
MISTCLELVGFLDKTPTAQLYLAYSLATQSDTIEYISKAYPENSNITLTG